MSQTFVAALVQYSPGPDPDRALKAGIDGIRDAHAAGARLVLLPELHAGPYFCQTEDPAFFDAAEPVPGPTTRALQAVAAELELVIVGSVFERRAAGVFANTAVVVDADGSLAGVYRKMHVPDDPGFHEKYYFTPGEQGFVPVPTRLGRLGVLVCWDQWFPEAARLMALAGADLLLYPTAIGWDPRDAADEQARQLDAWTTVQRGHAIANHLPVLSCNRHGFEADPSACGPGIRFWGSSFIAGPQGEILARAPTAGDAVLTATIDPARTEALRRIWPFLRDRRIDAYGGLSRRLVEV